MWKIGYSKKLERLKYKLLYHDFHKIRTHIFAILLQVLYNQYSVIVVTKWEKKKRYYIYKEGGHSNMLKVNLHGIN